MTTIVTGSGRCSMSEGMDEGLLRPGFFTDPAMQLCAEVAERLDEHAEASRLATRGAQETQARAGAREVQDLHRSADMAMWAGIVQGATTAASGVLQACTSPSSAGGAEGSGASGGSVGDPGGTVALGVLNGGGSAAAGLLGAESKHAQADSASARTTADRARGRADEQREDAQRATRSAERAIEHAGQILQAHRQAEQAALRA